MIFYEVAATEVRVIQADEPWRFDTDAGAPVLGLAPPPGQKVNKQVALLRPRSCWHQRVHVVHSELRLLIVQVARTGLRMAWMFLRVPAGAFLRIADHSQCRSQVEMIQKELPIEVSEADQSAVDNVFEPAEGVR